MLNIIIPNKQDHHSLADSHVVTYCLIIATLWWFVSCRVLPDMSSEGIVLSNTKPLFIVVQNTIYLLLGIVQLATSCIGEYHPGFQNHSSVLHRNSCPHVTSTSVCSVGRPVGPWAKELKYILCWLSKEAHFRWVKSHNAWGKDNIWQKQVAIKHPHPLYFMWLLVLHKWLVYSCSH